MAADESIAGTMTAVRWAAGMPLEKSSRGRAQGSTNRLTHQFTSDTAALEATRMTVMLVTASHHHGSPHPTIHITASESTAVSSAMPSRYTSSARRSRRRPTR